MHHVAKSTHPQPYAEAPEVVETISLYTGATARVLQEFFGDKVRVSLTNPAVHVTRTYQSLAQMGQEVEDARVQTASKFPDFSVVLFRPHFMLVSEEYPVKAHKNQWLLTMLSPPAIPCGGAHQGTHHGVWRADAFAVT
jgi:hypothetical protein